MRSNLAYSAYSQNHIAIESSEKLIKMLYEGILKFSSQAKRSIQLEDNEKKVYWINRTIAIFSELINSIDYNGGDIAHYLSGLYIQQIKLLAECNITNETSKLDEVIDVTKVLLLAWNEETEYAVDQ
jgi:flagellar protein FliS